MRNGQQASLSALLAVALGTAVLADRAGLVQPAQAQTEEEKNKKEREKQKAAPPKPQPPPPPPAKAPPPPPPRATVPPPPPPPRATVPPPPPPKPLQQQLPPPERPAKQFQQQQLPPAAKQVPPAVKPPAPPPPDPKKETIQRFPPAGAPPPVQQGVVPPPPKGPPVQPGVLPPPPKGLPPVQQGVVPPPPKGPAPAIQKVPPPVAAPSPGPGGPLTVTPVVPQRGPLGPQGPAPRRFDDVQKGRLERVEDGGRRKVIQEPGNRIIIKQDNRTIIRHDEAERFRRRPDARTEQRPNGNVETFYVRRDGVRIVTEVDAGGRLLRRYRQSPDGRERNIIDNRRFYQGLGVGIGIGVLGIIALNLPPPYVTIPRERYIVEYDRASDDDLDEALDAPPIEALERPYSLEEIRDNYELRARVRSIDLDTINFDSGAWEVPPDQFYKLERIARAILRLLRRNPEAVVMIAGFTDAVGSDEDNISLSDRRASAVAEILSNTFEVPPENLVTQGYGEQYLKIDTQGPEPRNRRVSFMNLTELMAQR